MAREKMDISGASYLFLHPPSSRCLFAFLELFGVSRQNPFFDACRARAKPQAPAHCTPIAYAGALILYYYRSTTVAFILVDNCYTQLYGCSFNASVAE